MVATFKCLDIKRKILWKRSKNKDIIKNIYQPNNTESVTKLDNKQKTTSHASSGHTTQTRSTTMRLFIPNQYQCNHAKATQQDLKAEMQRYWKDGSHGSTAG